MMLRTQLTILLIACLIFNVAVVGAEESEEKIIGQIVKVDSESGVIFIMHDSRIVKFRASKEICVKFKEKVQSFVEIGYSKCTVKGFCITSIISLEDGDSKNADFLDIRTDRAVNVRWGL